MVPNEVIESMKKTPSLVAHLIAETNNEQLDATDGKNWSTRTILAHLRDAEMYEFRLSIERLVAENSPNLYFWEPEKWEIERSLHRDSKEQILVDFALQRQASIALLQSLSSEQCTQKGMIGDKEINLLTVVDWWAHHDLSHIEQMEVTLGETVADAQSRQLKKGTLSD